ncbi:hypothetical protein [Clostridium sp.]|uniref:hypothetical protein n=1 Tax=Clostridium sp. TaxID=1506 RepID=UPI002634BA1F|nr:hypothetical protein [Clostridium sp.]
MNKVKPLHNSTSTKKEKFVYDIILVALASSFVLLLILGNDSVDIKKILNFDIKGLTLFVGILLFLLFPIRIFISLFNFKSKSMVSATFKVLCIICCIMIFLYVSWWALFGIAFYFKY